MTEQIQQLRTLRQVAIHLGLIKVKRKKMPRVISADLTMKSIGRAILRFYFERGFAPTHSSGYADRWFGHTDDWYNVNRCMMYGGRGLPGGTSLDRFCVRLKLPQGEQVLREVRRLTEQDIVNALRSFRFREGRFPNPRRDFDATEDFGVTVSWRAVEIRLELFFKTTLPQLQEWYFPPDMDIFQVW